MDKKGFIGMTIADLWSALFIVVLLIGFAFLFGASKILTKANERFLNDEASVEAESLLYTYLRSNVDEMTMVEYIIVNVDDISKIEEKSRIILDDICNYNDNKCLWKIVIMRKGEEKEIVGRSSSINDYQNNGEAFFILPRKDEKIIIKMVRYSNPFLYRR